MKDAGIGTPATRAAIIETLFAREYVVREKKALVPTNKGLVVYLAVKDKKIADVAMTGSWEHALAKIGEGKMDAATFHRSIEVYASQITTELLDTAFERQDDRPGCSCPKCKSGQVVFFQKVAKCSNEHCGVMRQPKHTVALSNRAARTTKPERSPPKSFTPDCISLLTVPL
jgi:DNA topoisomerase-3